MKRIIATVLIIASLLLCSCGDTISSGTIYKKEKKPMFTTFIHIYNGSSFTLVPQIHPTEYIFHLSSDGKDISVDVKKEEYEAFDVGDFTVKKGDRKMWKLEGIGRERGDCTMPYRVHLDKEYTVREFVDCCVNDRKSDWGYIGIRNDTEFNIFGKPNIEYKWGELITENFEDYILNKKIISVSGDGGWSRMDYILTID